MDGYMPMQPQIYLHAGRAKEADSRSVRLAPIGHAHKPLPTASSDGRHSSMLQM